MKTLIKNGYVIDPASGVEGYYDILVEGNRIAKVEKNLMDDSADCVIVDAEEHYVMPGFIDLHVHLREPGYEYKETIETGTMAAAAGGFTTICAMPNTKPATDNPEMIQMVLDKVKSVGKVNVLPIGAITHGQDGNLLTDMDGMMKVGAIGFSEDGKSVMNTDIYKEAMEIAAKLHAPIFAHCEDKLLVKNGVINGGKKAKELNLLEISNAVEDIITARDIILAKETGARLHLCHISTKDSIRMLALAKEEGLPVTGEVCPHHFILADDDIPADDGNYKMNPPLRSREDIKAIIEGIKSGVVDCIATDHAPHSEEEKAKGFATAPFGIVGLETAFPLTYTELVQTGILSLSQMVEKLSLNPAKILGISRGRLNVGDVADLVIVDINEEYSINVNTFYSKGVNTPFHGRKVWGRIRHTFVNGSMIYEYKKETGGLHD